MKGKRVQRILFLSILFILCANVLVPVSGNFIKERLLVPSIQLTDDDFDEAIVDYMLKGHMPSLALAIVKNSSMVWSKGYGYADVRNGKPATDKTVYMLASISKTFAATAIMKLWEQEYFDLDDDINDYLPFSVRNPNYPDVPITFRMLLAHRSSLGSRTINLFVLFSLFRLPYSSLGEYLTPGGSFYSPRNWRDYAPGDGTFYSCTGYELLGYLVECLTAQSLPEYCKQHIFEPLEMHNTSYYPADYQKDQLAVPYIYLLGRYVALPHFEDRNYASGGLRSTLEDLSHYLIAYMNQGQYNSLTFLKNDTVELMFTEQYPSGSFPRYGLGWQIQSSHNSSQNNTRIGHHGGMPGSQTYMFYHVVDDVGIIMLSNQHLVYTIRGLSSWFSIINLLLEKAKQY